MASAGKRRRRRRRRGSGQPMEDAEEKDDSVKNPDCIERLAQKYMQKCIVESSTESESESRVEVMPSPLAGGLKKAKESRGLQFLDPYDGDSEDASVHNDCGIKDAPWTNMCVPKAMPSEDADSSEGEETFPNPPNVNEIQAVNDCRAALEFPCLEKDLLQSPELPPATGGITRTGLTPDHAFPTGIDPSASADLPSSPAHAAPHPQLAAHSDGTMAKQPVIKRKQEIPAPEGASEKLKRKKFRAT